MECLNMDDINSNLAPVVSPDGDQVSQVSPSELQSQDFDAIHNANVNQQPLVLCTNHECSTTSSCKCQLQQQQQQQVAEPPGDTVTGSQPLPGEGDGGGNTLDLSSSTTTSLSFNQTQTLQDPLVTTTTTSLSNSDVPTSLHSPSGSSLPHQVDHAKDSTDSVSSISTTTNTAIDQAPCCMPDCIVVSDDVCVIQTVVPGLDPVNLNDQSNCSLSSPSSPSPSAKDDRHPSGLESHAPPCHSPSSSVSTATENTLLPQTGDSDHQTQSSIAHQNQHHSTVDQSPQNHELAAVPAADFPPQLRPSSLPHPSHSPTTSTPNQRHSSHHHHHHQRHSSSTNEALSSSTSSAVHGTSGDSSPPHPYLLPSPSDHDNPKGTPGLHGSLSSSRSQADQNHAAKSKKKSGKHRRSGHNDKHSLVSPCSPRLNQCRHSFGGSPSSVSPSGGTNFFHGDLVNLLHEHVHMNEDLSAGVIYGLHEKGFSIHEVLGIGISSTVRRVTEKTSGKEYAVKIIDISGEHGEPHIAEQTKRDTIREIRILHMCAGNENIIELHDVFETPTFIFLVFEICRKGELFDYLTSVVSLSEKKTRTFMRQLFEAVVVFHSKNIVHRDLKPENILLDDKLTLKVSDFGFATMLEDSEELTELCGTPGYLAPEVLAHSMYDNVSGYGKEVDLWACGVIMYTLLCGAPPFWHRKQMMMLRAIMNADYSFDGPEWDDITEDPKDLIQHLLLVNPKNRLTAKQALEHPFFHSKTTEKKMFNAKRKFKGGVYCVIFYNRVNYFYKHPPSISFSVVRTNPYSIKNMRKAIDSCAFDIYRHWVKRVDNQNRAALFEHSLREDWKHGLLT